MHNTKKYLHTFNSGLICTNKAACQLLCSSLLFCFWELNRFLKISVRDPRKILRVSRNLKLDPRNWFLNLENWNSKLEPRNSTLENFEDRESSRDCQLTFERYCISFIDDLHILIIYMYSKQTEIMIFKLLPILKNIINTRQKSWRGPINIKVIPQYCIAHPYCARFSRH